jgi:hypothetical protein
MIDNNNDNNDNRNADDNANGVINDYLARLASIMISFNRYFPGTRIISPTFGGFQDKETYRTTRSLGERSSVFRGFSRPVESTERAQTGLRVHRLTWRLSLTNETNDDVTAN